MISLFYAVCTIFICRGGVDSVQYGVDNMYAVCTMTWTTCSYTVCDMGYDVGIWCGYIF